MADNIRVAVRVRPFNDREKKMKATCCIDMVPAAQQTIIRSSDGTEKKFTFDFSYNSFVQPDDPAFASQDHVWTDIGEDVLNNAYAGYNCSLFAYGQTGSGKSFSMVGAPNLPGIIPRACEQIFKRIEGNDTKGLTFKVEASMLEIYMEKVRDLFGANTGEGGLRIRDHPKTGPYVEGLTRVAVSSNNQIQQLMDAGTQARTVASTNMNATSSRAHTIFQIVLTQTEVDEALGKATDKVSIINLIDLAGSERADSTGATGDRLKEGCAINKSLSALGNVISALAENANARKRKKTIVPYRDSVLTRLLKTSLGGNARTIMVAALSPASVNYEETLSTLRYADRAKQIKNKAVVNEDPNEKLISSLRSEIEELRKRLEAEAKAAAAGGADKAEAEEAVRLQLEAEQEESRRKYQEQLEASERLLQEQTKTWEDRLRETEALARAREEELAKLGLAVGEATRAEQAERAQRVPHLMNLHEDPAMSGALLYFLEKHQTTVGRPDAPTTQDVKLAGLNVKPEHCVIANAAGELSIRALNGAKVFVNGQPVEEAAGGVPLRHGDRVIVGMNHVFRLVDPQHASADSEQEVNEFDWHFAMAEINKVQLGVISEHEQRMRAKAEAEVEELRRKLLVTEALLQKERAEADMAEARIREEFEARERSIEEKIRARKAAHGGNTAAEADDDILQALIAELKQARTEYEKERDRLRRKTEKLQRQLAEQREKSETLDEVMHRRVEERNELQARMLSTIPLINEANTMASELYMPQRFSMRLVANRQSARSVVLSGDEQESLLMVDTELWIRVSTGEQAFANDLWHYDKFLNRLYLMREMYQTFVQLDRSLEALVQYGYTEENDPFADPPTERLIGTASVYLDPLSYMLDINEDTPIIDYRGKEEGELHVRIVPHVGELPPEHDELLDPAVHGEVRETVAVPASAARTDAPSMGGTNAVVQESQVTEYYGTETVGDGGIDEDGDDDNSDADDARPAGPTSSTTPTQQHPPSLEDETPEPLPADDFGVDMDMLADGEHALPTHNGRRVTFAVYVDWARGLPSDLSTFVYIRYRWHGRQEWSCSTPHPYRTINPQLHYRRVLLSTVTPELCRWVSTDALDIEVYGSPPDAGVATSNSVLAQMTQQYTDVLPGDRLQDAVPWSGGAINAEQRTVDEQLNERLGAMQEEVQRMSMEQQMTEHAKEAADAELQTLREENYRLQQEALQEQARLSKLKETAEAEARQLRAEREQLQAQLASQAEAEAARQKQAAQNVINNQLDSVQAPGGDANAAAAPGQTADATSKTCTIM